MGHQPTVLRGPVPDPEAVLALAAEAATADGVEPLSEQFRLGLTDAGPHVLVTDSDGELAGYAGVVTPPAGGPGAVEAVVTPDRRRRGLGRTLVTTAIELAGSGATVWAHGDLPAAGALASELGLIPVRTLLNLRLPLDGAELDATEPAGVTVRTYSGSRDDEAILAVNNAAFAWHPEQGGWGHAQIDERTGADWFDPRGLFLAEDADGTLLGFHWTKVSGELDDGGALGEVYVVAVAPSAQGRGIGQLLTAVGVNYLAARAVAQVELYVEGDNAAALRTYRNVGFTEHERHVAYAQK